MEIILDLGEMQIFMSAAKDTHRDLTLKFQILYNTVYTWVNAN